MFVGVFFYAAWFKIIDILVFVIFIGYYDMIFIVLFFVFVILLVGLEVVVGLSLLIGVWCRGSSLMVVLMLVMFIVVIGAVWVCGLSIDCGCFISDFSLEKVEVLRWYMLWWLVEDGGLLLAVLVVFCAVYIDEGVAI